MAGGGGGGRVERIIKKALSQVVSSFSHQFVSVFKIKGLHIHNYNNNNKATDRERERLAFDLEFNA